ncbi:hypothetical protein GUK58_02800 [Acinetobacter pittii]|uniref:nucleotide kinase domain-containing protein n=1 Tax=Acinetobacter pittii TaxID=48296 RepID=UPI00136FD659|nr:hypothetical protein [Acinetobacter pittii]
MINTKHQLNSLINDEVDSFKYLKSLDTSPVYETYWKFACKRQDIYFNRLSKKDLPWTEDPVLKIHKFTNAYRAADRVSQYLIKNVIYRDDLPNSAEEIFFRIMLFKFFNKIETWQLLEKKLGAITYKNYSFKIYDAIFQKAMESKTRIYSAAYIMPSGSSSFGFSKKHQNHLQLLEMMMNDNLAGKLARITKMKQAFELMRSYPTLGDFLAYQFITDINYSELTDFSEMEFVIPGPGAKDGLKKCFKSNNVNEQELIRFMANHQEQEFNRLGLHFQSLWGRPLQLIDCQNLFCEVDKYSRIVHPEIVGISGRTRIKQKYSCTRDLELPWFPPKWNINEKIHRTSIMVNSN